MCYSPLAPHSSLGFDRIPLFTNYSSLSFFTPLSFVSATIAAEGAALCSLSFGRLPISGWDTSTGCNYNTSKPLYRPLWCDWNGVSCSSSYSINSLYLYYAEWDYNSHYLIQNNFKQTIPTSIAGLKGLAILSLYGMDYTGPIPTSLFSLTQLNYLRLQYNSLTSSIPSAISNLKLLSQLLLDYNQLTSSIPTAVWNSPQLNSLSLQSNSLTGTIPSVIMNLNLVSIFLSGNSLSGTIPSSISALTNLQSVLLDTNHFSGKIPNIFGNFHQSGNWYVLLLHNNYFSEALPSMPYSYGPFSYTFDQNCQLTSAFSLVYLGSQTHCKPGTVGQLSPTAFPSSMPLSRTFFRHFLPRYFPPS